MSMDKINSEELKEKKNRIPLSDDEMEQVTGGGMGFIDFERNIYNIYDTVFHSYPVVGRGSCSCNPIAPVIVYYDGSNYRCCDCDGIVDAGTLG